MFSSSIQIPTVPGVYRFLDTKKNVLYIGKAKNIKKRLQQHFQGVKKASAKNRVMLEQVEDVTWTTTDTEVEALVLENLLIKEHRPKYNILLRDDKSFLYVKITMAEEFPDILLVRRITDHQATYFGPYTSAGTLRSSLDLLERLFPYKCVTFRSKGATGTACFNYHIGRCPGLCLGTVTPEAYRAIMENVVRFLKSDFSAIETQLEERMKKEAQERRFEQAAKTRDLLERLREMKGRQKIVDPNHRLDRDVIGTYRKDKTLFVSVYNVRGGRLRGQTQISLSLGNGEQSPAEIAERLLETYYDVSPDVPQEIVVETMPQDALSVTTWLEGKRGRKVEIIMPERGTKAHLLDLANRDAQTYARRDEVAEAQRNKFDPEKAVEELSKVIKLAGYKVIKSPNNHLPASSNPRVVESLNEEVKKQKVKNKNAPFEKGGGGDLKEIPNPKSQIQKKSKTTNIQTTSLYTKYPIPDTPFRRIECYDISHIGGKHTVASMVVFTDGKPANKLYRHFKISTIGDDIDDFRSMAEVLSRRLRHVLHPTEEERVKNESLIQKPDLIILDGGKGQLSRGVAVLARMGLTKKIPIISLAKENEDIFLPHETLPLRLDKGSSAQHLVEQLRDESHRFANSFHRRLRLKAEVVSDVDRVKGVGPAKRKVLLRTFGSLAEAKRASPEELAKVLGEKTAERFLSNG